MSEVGLLLLAFTGFTAAVFWGLWAWAIGLLRWRAWRGVPVSRAQTNMRDWPAAIALVFSLLAGVCWLVG